MSSKKELTEWLLSNYRQQDSIWLVTYKKSTLDKYVPRDEVLDALISFGWIDGIRRKLNDLQTMQLISPRKTQHWAQTYKERANRLIESGEMHAAGYQSIKEGKESGLWNFMDDVDKLIIPNDLLKELSKNKKALHFFNNINDSSKRLILRWIKLAKKKEKSVLKK